MLEVKKYKKPELSAMFGTKDMQGLKRKLDGYGVIYTVVGRGEMAEFTIIEILDEFKIFCITELGFNAETDFEKLLYFYYAFFNDEEFMAMPNEVKEVRTEEKGKKVSRSTIANYIAKLDAKDLINRNTTNYIYYFAFEHTQRMTDKAEYSQAWKEYWGCIHNNVSNYTAIKLMRSKYGGVARKQAIPEINGIYNDKIEYLQSLIQKGLEKRLNDNNV